MNLIDDFSTVLRKAWSIRLALLSAMFAGAEALLPFFPFFTDRVPPGILAALSAFIAIGAAISRLVKQPRMRNDAR